MVLVGLVVPAPRPMLAAGDPPASTAITERRAGDVTPCSGTGAPLAGDERILLPAAVVSVDGMMAASRDGMPGSGTAEDLAAVLADGPALPDIDDSTVLVAPPGRRSGLRFAVSRAPVATVTRVAVGLRIRAETGSTSVRIALYDRGRLVAEGPPRQIDPAAGWQELVEPFDPVVISDAAHLAVDIRVDGTPSAGRTLLSRAWVRAGLTASLRFSGSLLVGGGRTTAVTQAPGGGSVVVGTAASGLARAEAPGWPWHSRGRSMTEPDWMRIASLVRDPARPEVIYAATGDHGETGYLLRSEDDGRTWTLITGRLTLSAAVEPQRAGLPVALGTLIAVGHAPGTEAATLWVATIHDGLMRSGDGGATWVSLGLNGLPLRGLAQDPRNPDTIHLATDHAGVWVVRGAASERPEFRRVAGGPERPEELAWAGDTLLVAGGQAGLFRLADGRLEPTRAGLPVGEAAWTVIAADGPAGAAVAVAACDPCVAGPDGTITSLVRSIDGGTTWQPMPAAGPVRAAGFLADHLRATGPGTAAFRPLALSVRVASDGDPDAASVLVAADGAVWWSGGDGSGWTALVDGLGGSGARALTGEPGRPGPELASLAHLGTAVTTDGWRHARLQTWAAPAFRDIAEPVGSAIALVDGPDGPLAAIAVASGVRPPAGEVVVGPADDPGGWRPTGFAAAFPKLRPTGLAAGRDPRGELVLVATAQPAGGVVRRVGDGPWTAAEAGDAARDPKAVARADLRWVPGTPVVYLFDPTSGIHRSVDAGATWTLVWAVRANRGSTARLAVGADPSVVYASTLQGVVRLDGADRGTVEGGEVTVVPLPGFRRPGPIALDADGRLWVASGPLPGSPPRLAVTWEPRASEPTFHDVADELLAETMTGPDAIQVGVDGTVRIADADAGLLVGMPDGHATEPWLPPDVTLLSLEGGEGPAVALEPADPAIVAPLLDPVVIDVAPDGAAGWAGTTPVASLARAQERLIDRYGTDAAGLDRDVLIRVHAGRYEAQAVRWTFTRADRVIRIEGVPDADGRREKPRFVGCAEDRCTATRTFFELAVARGEPTNVQLVNLQVVKYHRAFVFRGGDDPATGWNGRNVIHRCDLRNIGTRFRSEVTPEVWSPGIVILDASRDNVIDGNRVAGSSNRLENATPWFHTIYASHGATGNRITRNTVEDTAGDFHVRDGSDGNSFAQNTIDASFYWAIVTEWSAPDETDVCGTRIDANVVRGDWTCEADLEIWHRETASPDGRCAASGIPDHEVTVPNTLLPPGPGCVMN